MKKLQGWLITVLFFNADFSPAQGSWQQVPGAPMAYRFEDVSFVNDSIGYMQQYGASSNQLVKTTDKGLTWSVVGPGIENVRSIEFLSEQTGFIGTLSVPNKPAGIYKTDDGGVSWIKIDTALTGPVGDGICGIAHKDSLVIAVGSVFSDRNVFKSTDAGQTWSTIHLDSLVDCLIDVYIIDSLTYLVAGQSSAASNHKAVIVRTNDGGQTWTSLITSNVANTYCWKIFMGQDSLGLASVEDFNGASVFRTDNYGQSWTEIPISGSYMDLGGIGLLNNQSGWVGSQHNVGLYETTDGGLTWSPVFFGVNMNRMVRLDSTTMFAAGETAYRYTLGTVGINETAPAPEDAHILKVYPNPASTDLSIELGILTNTNAVLTFLTADGKLLQTLCHQGLLKGHYNWVIDLKPYRSGEYIIHLRTNRQNFGKKVVVNKTD